jgi:hypothetical protein
MAVARLRGHVTATARACCTRPHDQGRFDSVVNVWLFMKRFDSAASVHCIVDCSFLEANRAIVIDLCDLAWTIAF